MTPLPLTKFAEELLNANQMDRSFIQNLMNHAAADTKGISASMLFGYAHVNFSGQQIQASLRHRREEMEMQERQKTRMKERERHVRNMKIAVVLAGLGITAAFVSIVYQPWLFNIIFVPTIFGFSGWGMWYTYQLGRREQARWIHENLQRRIGVEK